MLTSPTAPIDVSTTLILNQYATFLNDISDLDDYLNEKSLAALEQVATPRLIKAAEEQAQSIQSAHEHGTGILSDDHQVVTITSPTSASIFDCLNEQDWYLVEDATGTPDPGVVRGYFVGITDLILQGGKWYVDIWQPSQGHCKY